MGSCLEKLREVWDGFVDEWAGGFEKGGDLVVGSG